MELAATALVYCGTAITLVGILNFIWPWRRMLRSRRLAAVVTIGGASLAIVGFLLPVREHHVGAARTQLDSLTPAYEFNEVHSIAVAAPCEAAYKELRNVTADEIRGLGTLVWIRRFGRSGPESILNPPKDKPILEVALRTGFHEVANDPGRELVVATVLRHPVHIRRQALTPEHIHDLQRLEGVTFATMNFFFEATGAASCNVSTETRVHATDGTRRREFARYWRVIYPGSAIIRRMWLRAIKSRAEHNRVSVSVAQ